MSDDQAQRQNQRQYAHAVIIPGNHDGVHLGHRALIYRARAYAGERGWRAVALTFDPHPTQILAPDRVPPLLTTIERRCELMKGAGADQVIVQQFGEEFASLSPEDFMQKWLFESLNARALVVGPNFGFGNRRSGDVQTLRRLGKKYDFEVLVVEPIRDAEEIVSSSAIRHAISKGDLQKATRYLGRVHEVSGKVVPGDKRGRELGFPTANLSCDSVLLPPDGVYAVAARKISPLHSELLYGVANIGVRPTFQAGRSVEAHLFDFDEDLYGATLRIGFVTRIRGEKSYQTADQLRKQIEKDSNLARALLPQIEKGELSWL
ncbi:MAG: bifunctional riboflavin kinase/FAD synthetase [Deltaproteobacteria bacterium]|nr:bifunctional riboflavin kinase/FAD synthetase [Deltaproteobacteria bacterium]